MMAIEASSILDAYLASVGKSPQEYNISTPIDWSLSSDDDDDEDEYDQPEVPEVFKASMKSTSAISDMSTMDLSNMLPRQQSEPVLPSEVLDTIKRQDAVIEHLTNWCRTLADHTKMHHLLLAEQELSQAETRQDNQILQRELMQLKTSARLRAKEVGVEINELNHELQERMDSKMPLCHGKAT